MRIPSRLFAVTLAALAGAAALDASPAGMPAAQAAPASRGSGVTPRQAVQIMQDAGYWGIGGVTRNDPYYFAAAMSPARKRVRVAVDVRTGAIAKVTVFPRGAGSVRPPDAVIAPYKGMPVDVKPDPIPPRNYYQSSQPVRPIGRLPVPGTQRWQQAPVRCRTQILPGC